MEYSRTGSAAARWTRRRIGIEVATVKLSPPGVRGRGIGFRGATLNINNYSVLNAITFAYIHERQVSGAPPGIDGQVRDRDQTGYRRSAQRPSGEAAHSRFWPSGFSLRSGRKRELSVYAITQPADLQHKMTAAGPAPNLNDHLSAGGAIQRASATMTELAQSLQTAVLDHPVINQTRIEGRFDFTLDWMPDETQFATFGTRTCRILKGKHYEAFEGAAGSEASSKSARRHPRRRQGRKPSEN